MSGVVFNKFDVGKLFLVIFVKILIKIVVLIELVICWKVLFIVVLWFNKFIGKVFMLEVVIGIMIIEILNIWIVYRIMI